MLLAATPAFADEVANAEQVEIAVSGTIRQQCSMGSIGNMDFGDLNRSGLAFQQRIAFDCNVPFTMTITGQSGALTHTTMPNGQEPYGGAVPYSVGIQMPVRFPAQKMINRTFDSRQLRGGGTISSNGGIATDDMLLAVQLGAPSGEAGLLAGNYSETITITVSPT
jgi:spore coat protein U-like protein